MEGESGDGGPLASTAVLIDGGYLDAFRRDELGGDALDLLALSGLMCSGRERLGTWYYHCMPWAGERPSPRERRMAEDMERHLGAVRRLPRFEVRLGALRRHGWRFVQKRVDTLLAVDLVRLALGRRAARVALLSGDDDHVPAVEAAREEGVSVALWHQAGAASEGLLAACDESVAMTPALVERARLPCRPSHPFLRGEPEGPAGADAGAPAPAARAAGPPPAGMAKL